MPDKSITVDAGLLVYFFAPLVAIFLSPLAAIVFVIGYWIANSNATSTTD